MAFGTALLALGLAVSRWKRALASIIEIVWQLRGEAGPRQIKNVRLGLELAAGIGPIRLAVILKK